MDETPLTVEPLGPDCDRTSFSCREPFLDPLHPPAGFPGRPTALRADLRCIGEPSERIAGYYTLSAASFEKGQPSD